MSRFFSKGRALAWVALFVAIGASLFLLKQPTATDQAVDLVGGTSRNSALVGSAANDSADFEGAAGLSEKVGPNQAASQPQIQRALTENSGYNTFVRAILTTNEDEAGHAPNDCEGWTVIATTVERHSRELSTHTAQANAQGVAEFAFSEQVRLVQLSCLPPLESGLGVAKHDGFVELEQGEDFEALLYFSTALAAGGRVVDLDGEPVAGAKVHAFNFDMGAGLADWRPGLLIATTDSSGRFEFHQMHQDVWVAAVEPHDWLMIDPTFEEQSDSKGILSFYDAPAQQNPDRWDFGILQVMAIDRTLLTVTDGANQPAVALFGYAEPLLLNEPRLIQTPSSQKTRAYVPVEMREFLNDGKSGEASLKTGLEAPYDFGLVDGWPYAEVWFRTNSKGQAHLALPDGKWRLKLFPPDAFLSEEDFPPLDFSTGSGHLEYQLPTAIGAIRGRLVFADGTPAKYADLYLHAENMEGAGLDSGTMSAKDGYFEFPALELGAHFTVRAVPDDRYCNFIATEWELQASAQSTTPDFVIDAGLTTRVHFTAKGYDFEKHNFRLRANRWFPAASTTATDREAWWSTVQNLILNISKKPVVLPMMPPGKVEYLVMATVGTGSWTSNGQPYTKRVEWSRVILEVGALDQEVELDLEGYEAPQTSIAKHHGVVLDQYTGQPIKDAHVFLWRENRSDDSQSQITDTHGNFQFSNGSGSFLLMASAAGYAPHNLALREYAAGEHEHRILLEPLQNRFTLLIVDRDGAAVPDCTVSFPNADGQKTAVFEQGGYFATYSCLLTAGDAGALHLIGMEPGAQRIHIDFWGAVAYDLAFQAPNIQGQQVKVVLPVSLAELREALQTRP